MVWVSYGIGIVSIFILAFAAVLVIGKQIRTSSRAVLYFLGLIICMIGWIIGNLLIVYFSQIYAGTQALICSRFATIISMVGMVSIVLFVRTISKRLTHTPIVLVITMFLFGGVFGLTISGDYEVVHQLIESGGYYFYIAKTSILGNI